MRKALVFASCLLAGALASGRERVVVGTTTFLAVSTMTWTNGGEEQIRMWWNDSGFHFWVNENMDGAARAFLEDYLKPYVDAYIAAEMRNEREKLYWQIRACLADKSC